VPDTQSYRLMGFIVIAGAFIMQIAMVVHKRYELKKMSLFLLGVVMAVFSIQLVFYWIFRKSVNPLVYPIGYLLSSVIYLFFVSFSQFPFFFKSLIYRVKSFYPSSLEI
jgi:hypothetical protein